MAAAIGQEIRKSIVQKNKQEAARQGNECNGDNVNGDLRTSAENSEYDCKGTIADDHVRESEDMKYGGNIGDDESACSSSGSGSVAGNKEGFSSVFGADSGCGSSSACGSSSRWNC